MLISPYKHHHYSSMVAGYLQGTYREAELAFDLVALCRRAGARFIEAKAERIDSAERTVEAGGEQISFDLASLDVGSDPVGINTPGVVQHAYTVRPMTRALELKRAVMALNTNPAVCVVGGGAGGVEIALAIHRMISNASLNADVTVLERDAKILAEHDNRTRARAVHILHDLGIRIRTNALVARVSHNDILVEPVETLPSDLTVWLTGAAAPGLLAGCDLPKDDEGFLLVDRTLRAVDGSPVWGAGDCVTLRDFPRTPKTGVYAVREAPVLAFNLRAALGGEPPMPYTPQSHSLALLNTADGKALLIWRFLGRHSRGAWWLKDYIDRAFMRKYQGLIRDP